MKVLVVAEYYPRVEDPTLGIWAHRQALAARDAGASVQVLVLHRPVPPLAAARHGDFGAAAAQLRQPATTVLDGLAVRYLRYLSPPRPWSYATWGAWAAPWLRRALQRVRAEFPFNLVHAHYAVPAGDAVRRATVRAPLVISVHGGDVLGAHAGAASVRRTLGHARLVLANSAGIARRCLARGALRTQVLHLGTDLPERVTPPPATPTLVTVGNLIARKRHAEVIRAVARLRDRWPALRYEIVGDGPERGALIALAAEQGVADRVRFRGRLDHDEAVAVARCATLFVMPSVAEAFGVAYVEAMAAGVPAIGCRGEDGPEEIAAAGGGMQLVRPGGRAELAEAIDVLLSDEGRLAQRRAAARQTVATSFTWQRCGQETVRAYEEALRG
ncbi:MAG: glycosyltransferase [Solirubrobacterales bacterium]|nr:glycosyltransferase [Solirubrobacterales bacterium]